MATITMITKCLIASLSLCVATAVWANTYTGGIPLSSTLDASKHSLALTKGDPRPVVALAMRHGKARGHFAGQAAAFIKQKTGIDAPIYVEATKKGPVKGQPQCNEVELKFFTSPAYASTYPEQISTMAVCPNR